jgi:hypothetical protein
MPNLDIFVTQTYGSRVSMTIDKYTHVIHQAQGEAAVGPGLSAVSEPTLLCAKE